MKRYVQVSGAFFGLLALIQLTRTILQWPIQVADVTVPLWASGLACVFTGTFAVWAFQSGKSVA